MVFRDDMEKTINRVLKLELLDLTEDEVEEVTTRVIEAIALDHACIEDEDDFSDDETDDDEVSDERGFVDEDLDY